MKRFLPLLLLLAFAATEARAQGIGIGGQLGDPTGLTVRAGTLDLAAGWDISNDKFFGQAHFILGQTRLSGAGADLRLFYGPGVFLGAGEGRNDDVRFGVSFNGGLAYFLNPRLEIFGQLTPRLQLVDETDFDLGGAAGLRFYL